MNIRSPVVFRKCAITPPSASSSGIDDGRPSAFGGGSLAEFLLGKEGQNDGSDTHWEMPIVENDPCDIVCDTACDVVRAAAKLSEEGKLGRVGAGSHANPPKTPRHASRGSCVYPVSSLLKSNPMMIREGFQLIISGGPAPPEPERRVGGAVNPRFDASMNDLESDPLQEPGFGSRNPVLSASPPDEQNVLASQSQLPASSPQAGPAEGAKWFAPSPSASLTQQLGPPRPDAPRSDNPLLSRATRAAGACARFFPVAGPQSTCAQSLPVTGAGAPQFPSLFSQSGVSRADFTPPPAASLLSLYSSRIVAAAAGHLFLNSHRNAVEHQQEHQEEQEGWQSRQHNKRALDLNKFLPDEVEGKRHCGTQQRAADSAASGGSGGAKSFAWNATPGDTPAVAAPNTNEVAAPNTPAIATTYNAAPSTPAVAASRNAASTHAGSPGSNGMGLDSVVSNNGSLCKGEESQPSPVNISPSIFELPQSVRSRVSKVQKSHVCKICNRRFSSGQALGGHMRKPWQGEKADSSLEKLLLETKPGDGVEQASTTLKTSKDESDEGGNSSPPCTQQGGWEGSSNRPHQVHHSFLDNNRPHLVVHRKPLEKDSSRARMFAEACGSAVLDRHAAPASPFFPSQDRLDLDLRL